MKTCNNCDIEKDDHDFNLYKRKGKPFLCSNCKSCELEIRRTMVKDNPKINEDRARKAREVSKTPIGKFRTMISALNKNDLHHSITFEEYFSLLENKCEYCYADREKFSVCPKDINLGYVSGNLMAVCEKCKYLKSRCSTEDAFQRKMIRKYGTTPEKQTQLKSLIGKKFNLLTVESVGDKVRGSFYLNCKCECGKNKVARERDILEGNTKSCGCLNNNPTKCNFYKTKRKSTLNNCDRMYRSLKSRSRARSLENRLTYEEYKAFYDLDCFYCNKTNDTHGLDRLDSSKGYIIGNIVSCCKICNTMKNVLSYEDFVSHIRAISRNIQSGYVRLEETVNG